MDRYRLGLPPGHFCTFARHDFRNVERARPHTHDFHEFFWVEKGGAAHWINGEETQVKAGDLVIIRADDRHCFGVRRKGDSARIVNFAFPVSIWNTFRRRYYGGAGVFFSQPSLAARSYELAPHQLAALQVAARHLRGGSRRLVHVEGFLVSVLTLLHEERAWTARGDGAIPRWIVQACALLRSERRFAGGIPALARLAARSPEHVAREFRRHLGRTPTEIVNEARMSYAADRLATSADEVVQIALDCGLENLGHFYRLFRAHVGCTPHGYRLQQQAVLRSEAP